MLMGPLMGWQSWFGGHSFPPYLNVLFFLKAMKHSKSMNAIFLSISDHVTVTKKKKKEKTD